MAYGDPVIHGSARGIAAVGLFSVSVRQRVVLSVNVLFVASSNSYRFAPRTGCQANAGVRGKVRAGASSARSRKGFSALGAGSAAFATGANASIAKMTAARRTAGMAN